MDYSELCIKLKAAEREYHAACLKKDEVTAYRAASDIKNLAPKMQAAARELVKNPECA